LGLTQAQLNANPRSAGTNSVLDHASKTIRQNQVGAVLEQRISPDLSFEGRIYDGARENFNFKPLLRPPRPPTRWALGLD